METGSLGKVGFGDHFHLFGEPRGTAVVCWSRIAPVAVRGYAFADSGTPISYGATVTYLNHDVVVASRTFSAANGSNADALSVSDTRTNTGITKVRIT